MIDLVVPLSLRRPDIFPVEFLSKRLLVVNPPKIHSTGSRTAIPGAFTFGFENFHGSGAFEGAAKAFEHGNGQDSILQSTFFPLVFGPTGGEGFIAGLAFEDAAQPLEAVRRFGRRFHGGESLRETRGIFKGNEIF
jgi:hypothetical protein